MSKADQKRTRYNLELSTRLDDSLENIATEHETSKAEVVRFAVDLLAVAMKAKKDGLTVGAWGQKPDGVSVERVFVGL